MQLTTAKYKTALFDCKDWKPIKDYEYLYEIHWRGVVRNAGTKMLLRSGLAGNGYFTVALYKDKKPKTHTIHTLVASHFVSNPKSKRCVNHKDGNKINNHVSNLEYATHGENNSHAIRTGLKRKSIEPKGVIQMDMDGNEIARYPTSEHVPGFRSGNICLVCRGKRNQHGGYKWAYINK